MKTGSFWRDKCRPIIANAVGSWDGKDERELRKTLFNLYPFGERARYPYKIWLNEIALQLKQKRGITPKRLWKDTNSSVELIEAGQMELL